MAVAWISTSPILYIQGGTTATTTFAASPPAGSTVVLTLGAYEPAGVDPVVTDNQGNTWVRLFQEGSLGNNSAMLYVCWAIAGGASLTITVVGANGSYITGAAAAFTPLQSPVNASGVVATDTAASAGQSVSTSAASTEADAVSISVMGQSGSIVLTNYTCTGFTSIFYQPSPNVYQPGGAAYRIETTTGVKTAAWTWDNAPGTQANSVIAVLKGVVSGVTVTPVQAAVALGGPAPTVAQSANQAVSPAQKAIALSGPAPTIAQSSTAAFTPAQAALALSGPAPTVVQSANQAVSPAQKAIALVGPAPTVVQSVNQAVSPANKALALSGPAPTIGQGTSVIPSAATVSLAGPAPTLAQTANQVVSPGVAALSIQGPAPDISTGTPSPILAPLRAAISIQGPAPSITQRGQAASAMRRWAAQQYQEYFDAKDRDREAKEKAAANVLAEAPQQRRTKVPRQQTAVSATQAIEKELNEVFTKNLGRLESRIEVARARVHAVEAKLTPSPKTANATLARVIPQKSVVPSVGEQDEDDALLLFAAAL